MTTVGWKIWLRTSTHTPSDPAEMHFRWRGSWAINSDGSLDATCHRIRERFPMSWGLVRHALNEGVKARV
jgi:hypothetical protein